MPRSSLSALRGLLLAVLPLLLLLPGSSALRPAPLRAAPAARVSSWRLSSSSNDEDIIERIFGRFFGPKEDKPFGLSRYTVDSNGDLFPATYELLTEPFPGDSKDAALVRPLLKQTCLAERKLRLAYDAGRNGWRASSFHRCVDKQGPAVLLARTAGGAVCGGYNSRGWAGFGEQRPGISSFLFTWRDGNTDAPPVKLRKVGGAGVAVIDNANEGPCFGSGSLCAYMRPGSERSAVCQLGPYYERLPDGGNSLFADGESRNGAQLVELKVLVGVYGPDEEVPFSDAIPFSLS